MIKVVLMFLVVFGVFFFGIKTARTMSGKQALEVAKLVLYSVACAVLTTAALIGFVVLF